MWCQMTNHDDGWKSRTCEGCYYAVGNRCRRAISSYGYPQVVNHGRYQLACSFHKDENETHTTQENKGLEDAT